SIRGHRETMFARAALRSRGDVAASPSLPRDRAASSSPPRVRPRGELSSPLEEPSALEEELRGEAEGLLHAGDRDEAHGGAEGALRVALLERRDALQRRADRAVLADELRHGIERAVDVAVRDRPGALERGHLLRAELRALRPRPGAGRHAAGLIERLLRARQETRRVAGLRGLEDLLARRAEARLRLRIDLRLAGVDVLLELV